MFSCVRELTQITETEIEQVEPSETLFFGLFPISIELIRKLNFKKWCMNCPGGTYVFYFTFSFWF